MASGDYFRYDTVALAWECLTAIVAGTPPTPRMAFGFASADGKLYVHGGYDDMYGKY